MFIIPVLRLLSQAARQTPDACWPVRNPASKTSKQNKEQVGSTSATPHHTRLSSGFTCGCTHTDQNKRTQDLQDTGVREGHPNRARCGRGSSQGNHVRPSYSEAKARESFEFGSLNLAQVTQTAKTFRIFGNGAFSNNRLQLARQRQPSAYEKLAQSI